MHTDSERYLCQSVPSALIRVRLRGPLFRHHLLIRPITLGDLLTHTAPANRSKSF